MSRKTKGLTLIEVLVVVTILSVLALTLYTVFKSGIDAWSKSEDRLDIYQNARVVLDQMSRELPGAIVSTGGATFIGNDSTLEFVTNFAGLLYMIKYEIPTDTTILQRSYDENPTDYSDPDYTTIEFSDIVNSIQFRYWDTDASDWRDNWDSTEGGSTLMENKLAPAVEITLTLKDPEEHTYPFKTTVYLPNSE